MLPHWQTLPAVRGTVLYCTASHKFCKNGMLSFTTFCTYVEASLSDCLHYTPHPSALGSVEGDGHKAARLLPNAIN